MDWSLGWYQRFVSGGSAAIAVSVSVPDFGYAVDLVCRQAALM
tara:strand:+ start:8332 stop:8460 length:129 start_codon:yes stop_codon:yes gene_type:complete